MAANYLSPSLAVQRKLLGFASAQLGEYCNWRTPRLLDFQRKRRTSFR